MVKFDDVLDEINGFGKYQKLRYFLICLAGLLPPITVYIHSFMVASPKYRCALPDLNGDSFLFTHENSSYQLEKCSYTMNNTRHQCERWVFDRTFYQSTLTEEWSMVCEKAIWRSNVQTIYFSGLLFGSFIIGILSDKFGRRPIVLASFLFIVLGGLGVTFGPQKSFGTQISYVIYAISRFIIAIGTRGINLTAYVLGMELLDARKKTFGGMIFQLAFPVGQLILVTIAYFIRDWRTLALVCCIPSIPFLLYYFILPESPRWLVSKNRKKEALDILKHVSKVNKRKLNEQTWSEFLATEEKIEAQAEESLLTVLKSIPMLILLFVLMIHWIVNNFVFYGLGLKSTELGANPYLTFSISAFVELLGVIGATIAVDKLGRKWSYGGCLFVAGVACLSILFTSDEQTVAIVTLAMVGKFFVASSYAIVYLFSSELFPTSIRNSCIGVCSMMARVGSMTAPLINALGELGWKNLPFLIFGVSGVLVGLTTVLLPETHGKNLPNTINEAENVGIFRKFKKNKK